MRLKARRMVCFLLAFGLVIAVTASTGSALYEPYMRFWHWYDGENWTQAKEDAGAVFMGRDGQGAVRQNNAWQFKVGEKAWFPIHVDFLEQGCSLEISLDNPGITDGLIRDMESGALWKGREPFTYCGSNGQINAVSIGSGNCMNSSSYGFEFYDEMYMVFNSVGSLAVTATLKQNGNVILTKQMKFAVAAGDMFGDLCD